MAFVIKNIVGASAEKIKVELQKILAKSRFVALVENSGNKIAIRNVKLKTNKDYCGNHPFACPVRPFRVETPHKKLNFLEGADWVAFNDMINDVLDNLGVSANVASSLVIIRKGENRCVNYGGHALNEFNNEWDKEGKNYENQIGRKAERSKFPEGTPGIPEYLT